MKNKSSSAFGMTRRLKTGWSVARWPSYALHSHWRWGNLFIHEATHKAHSQYGDKYEVYLSGAGPGGCAKYLQGFKTLTTAKEYVEQGDFE